MNNKKSYFKIIVIIIIVTLSITACIATGGGSAEVEALKQQVDALATQNAILLEDKQNSANGNDSGEVNAPAPPDASQDTQIETAEPTQESLPEEPVSAGTTVFYDGWALTMANEIDIMHGDEIRLSFTIRNTGDNSRVFRYIKSGIKLFDDQGNEYLMKPWNSCPDDLNITHQISLGGGSKENISSSRYKTCNSSTQFPIFEGRISHTASYLVITVDNWGPFNGVVFHLNL